jgi:hypothetical protein
MAATSALPAEGGDFASTSLDRPALGGDVKQAPAAPAWAPTPMGPPATSAAAAAAPSKAKAPAPAPRAPAGPPPVPKSDLPLKLAIGGAAALIVILLIALVVGLMSSGDEEPIEGDELLEPTD